MGTSNEKPQHPTGGRCKVARPSEAEFSAELHKTLEHGTWTQSLVSVTVTSHSCASSGTETNCPGRCEAGGNKRLVEIASCCLTRCSEQQLKPHTRKSVQYFNYVRLIVKVPSLHSSGALQTTSAPQKEIASQLESFRQICLQQLSRLRLH